MNNYFIIIPTCIFVKGFHRSAIYDIQREVIDFIPNDLYNFCLKHNKQRMTEIISHYNGDDVDIVNEYIEFLLKNEYVFMGSLKDSICIENISLKWEYLGVITNCVCEYSSLISEQIQKLCHVIDENLKCQAFELISFEDVVPLDTLDNVLNHFNDCLNVHHIELILPFNEEYEIQKIQLILKKYFCINRFVIHSSPNEFLEKSEHTILLYIQQAINSCGFIGKNYFSLNLPHITESMKYNNCLNKKMFIDKEGYIKNCPFTKEKYGNIFVDDINKVVNQREFRCLWNINKDKIQVCKDCEFRYVCSDCRVFIKDPTNSYSQPVKCNYNPYIGKWIDEDGYITVEEFRQKDIHNKQ